MKRLSFKTIGVFSIMSVMSSPAFADKTPLELLKEGKDQVRTKLESKALSDMKFTAAINGKNVEVSGPKEGLPEICVEHLELTDVEVKGPAEKIEFKKIEDLDAYAHKVIPILTFVGVPAVKTLPECIAHAGSSAKLVALPKDKFTKAKIEDKQIAKIALEGSDSKSAEYLRLEAEIKKITCDKCNEKEEKSVVDTKDTKKTTEEELIEVLSKAAEDRLNKFIDDADAAKDILELAKTRDALMRYVREIESSSLSESAKLDIKNRIYAILTQGIPAKAVLLGSSQMSPDLSLGSTGTAKSGDFWSGFRSPKADVKVGSSGNAYLPSRTVAFIAATMRSATTIKGIDADQKEADFEISKQLMIKFSAHRTELISRMDANDAEVGQAIQSVSQVSAQDKNQFMAQCSRGINQYNFTHCGNLKAKIEQSDAFVQNYSQRFQAAQAQDQLMFSNLGFSGGNSNMNWSNPIASSTAPNYLQNNLQSNGANYQNTFDASALYRPQGDWRQQGNSSLPVATPLGMPTQQYQRSNQFQS